MKTIPSSRRHHYMARLSIFLVIVALIAGMVGCAGVRYDLTISSTEGGEVKSPGEGILSPGEGTVVKLVAEPEDGYQFVNWTGNVSTIADVNAAATNITMDGDYSITANFALEILEIWDWNDLYAIRNNLHSQHILMTSLNSTSANYTELAGPTADRREGWRPIGTRNDPFTGSFDGQNHTIMGLFINRPHEDYVGLFGYVDEKAVVENIGLVNVTIIGEDNVGGLVGNNGGTVSSSNSTGSVTGEDNVGGLVGDNEDTVKNSYSSSNVIGNGKHVGGLVGYNLDEVSDSYSTGSVTGIEDVGGLVGWNEGTVSSSNSTGNVTGSNMYVGGLVGQNHFEARVSDSYSTGNVTGDKYVGGLVGFNYKSTLSNSHYNYDEVLINGQNIITIGALFGEDFDEWLANDKFLDVTERLSQKNGYYEVNNVTDFKELLVFGQNSLLEFRLTHNLDLGNETNFYIPYLAGKFYGNNHKISNFSFNFDFVSQLGLFGYLGPGGTVTQVGVENVNIAGASFVGGLVGASWESTVSSSNSTGSITGDEHVGGLVGYNYKESTVTQCYSSSNVTGDSYVGGLVGDNEWSVNSSYSTGSVTGNWSVGGLVGCNYQESTVLASNSTGSVTGKNDVGGLVGINDGTVSESYSTGNVIGDDGVGGLVGINEGKVENSHSSSNVTGSNDYVGGLVGYNNDGGTVSESYSTGNVTGNHDVGGLVGFNGGTVSESYSIGNVTGDDGVGGDSVGGLVGGNRGEVRNSYSTGSVMGDEFIGGLVGRSDKGIVNSSYSTGSVSGNKDVGGLVGCNDEESSVTRSFWNTETSGQPPSPDAVGVGKNNTEMKSFKTFKGLGWRITRVANRGEPDTSETWNIIDIESYPNDATYPFLSWEPV